MLRILQSAIMIGVLNAAAVAVTLALLSVPVGNWDSPLRIAIAAGGMLLVIVIAVAGWLNMRWRLKSETELVVAAHRYVDRASELLEEPRREHDQPSAATINLLVTRLQRLLACIDRLVAERREREREVMRADQLVMVGQMAAGVAHELRNPLTSIKLLVQSGQKDEASALTKDDMAIIEHEIRRLERSLQRFLDFARPPHPERRPLDLAPLIERVMALIEGRARKQRVNLSFSRTPEPVIAEVDADQIQQLLLNLMLNSLDVMPEGGSLAVELRRLQDGQAELSVRDTGPGIPSTLLPRLFDPFVSTKETGIGLGLAVSHRIAERHGGNLTAHNQPNGGACFVLRLNPRENVATVAGSI